jgi:glyoxylase-like metal-dependent hydrolase (beta-lactamase superfamily II)
MQASSESAPPVGMARTVGNGVRAILAPNPSPMTHWGTNTYLLGTRALAVIDPGPDDPAHLAAILGALGPGQSVSHIFVTHAHLDHSPLAARLSVVTGAPVLAYGDAVAGRSAVMARLAEAGGIGGGEGVDAGFAPDLVLCDGERVAGDGWQITAHWTPGHFGNHMSFQAGGDVFSGDLVMGWASTLISPPDGDLTQFRTACARLSGLRAARLLPGHGAPIDDPAARIAWLLEHRDAREAAILNALQDGPACARALAARIYTDTPTPLMSAAARNVLAHLIDLKQNLHIDCLDPLGPGARFALPARPGGAS